MNEAYSTTSSSTITRTKGEVYIQIVKMSTRRTYKVGECDICKEEHSESTISCEACHMVVKKYQNKTKYPMEDVRKALENAYFHKDREKKESYFECE